MAKGFKSALAIILTLVMLLTAIPAVSVSAESALTVTVATVSGMPGTAVQVDVSIKNNPGIAAIALDVDYDKDNLTLTDFSYNTEALAGASTTPFNAAASVPCLMAINYAQNMTGDFTLATLTFQIKETAGENVSAPITLSYDKDNIYNIDEINVPCTIENGAVKIITCIPGDINGDEKVNSKDVSRLMQYHAHWDVEVNEPALDTNGDGKLNSKDVTRLMQYLAHWDVILYPDIQESGVKAVTAKAPTCDTDGNIAYWFDNATKKYYRDSTCLQEITQAQTVIPATGHTPVIDAAIPPTRITDGKTEGSHCAVCGKVLVEQQIIPASENYIIYNIAGENPYLQKQTINNANPSVYSSNTTLRLKNISCPGYTFLGWYDLPEGAAAAESVKEIPAGTEGEIELYAWWSPVTYNIEFKSDLIPVTGETYTVEHAHVLPVPSLGGYIFVGWSDDDGNIIKTIPEGTTGHKTYTANWMSERNQAWAKQKIGDPVAVIEDDDTNTILFAYEIGEIHNVPLQVIEDFGKINSDGVTKEVTKEITRSVNSTQMDNYTKTVQKVTTDSYGWTLANEWSEGISIDEEWATEHGMSVEEAEVYCKSNSNNWYVSNGSSGSSSTVTLDTSDNYNLKTTTKNTKTYDTHDQEDHINGKMTGTVGNNYTPAKYEMSIDAGTSINNKTGTEGDKGSESQGGNLTHTGTESTHSSSWNSESGFGGSETVSQTNSVTRELTEKISSKTGYGKNYIQNENHSKTQGYSAADTNGEQYSSSVTYSLVEGKKESVTYKTTNTKSGYHRWVVAGTAHVFGVVGYDIKTSSYFVYTTSILDDETHDFEDYSYSYASYDDNQNTVIPFEVPFGIEEYVQSRVCGSDGLVVSKEGVVTGYNGTGSFVTIPEYKVLDNRDGTKSVVKITGISSDAFTKKNSNGVVPSSFITGIALSDFITEIPANAFKDCTKLWEFNAYNINAIGDNAFQNCTALKSFVIGESVNSLGNNVVSGLDKITVYASNKNIVEAAIQSGAKEIVVYISDKCNDLSDTTLAIPASTESFTFNGMGKTFENVLIESDAAKTVINRATFTSTGKTPLKISSPVVELNDVSAQASSIALILSADTTDLSILGTIALSAESGKSMLSKNLNIAMLDEGISSEIDVYGKLLICGQILEGNEFFKAPITIEMITEEEFAKYYIGTYKLTFDPNGGTLGESEQTKEIYAGTKYGDLPVPFYDYHSFKGWFTEKDGGVHITKDVLFEGSNDITLYAHWVDNPTSDWVLESDVPADAQLTGDVKWTYDLVTRKKSSDPTMDGYTKYDESWVWGVWGPWSGWSRSAPNPGASESRQVESRTVTDSDAYTTYEYWRYVNDAGTLMSAWQGTDGCNNYQRIELTYPLQYNKHDGGMDLYKEYVYNGNTYLRNHWLKGKEYNHPAVTHTEWRYRDRSKVWTYYFKKTEPMESSTEVVESINETAPSESITNVKKWVKYINKSNNGDGNNGSGTWGDWSAWSRSAPNPGASNSRQVESKTVTDQAGYTSYQYWIYRTANGNGWGTQGYSTSQGVCTVYDEININYQLGIVDSSIGTYGYYQSSNFSSSVANQWFLGGSTWHPAVTHTEWRYRDRT